jgi:hypothetical protein
MFDTEGILLGICAAKRLDVGYFCHRDEIYFALAKHAGPKLKPLLPAPD